MHMLLSHTWDQRLLSPWGAQLTMGSDAANSVCSVRRSTGRSRSPVRHDMAAGQSGTERVTLSKSVPNGLCCPQPPLLLAKWLREESQWHNKKNKHSTTPRNCSMTHQLQAPPKASSANSTECTVLDRGLPAPWEQPLSPSRLFCLICSSQQKPVDLIHVALYANLRSHPKFVFLKTQIKLFLQRKLVWFSQESWVRSALQTSLQTCLLLGVVLTKEPPSDLLNTQKNAYDYFGSGENHFLPSFIEWD